MRLLVKDAKDCYTLLPTSTLSLLREYWEVYRPHHAEGWLFLGPYGHTHMTDDAVAVLHTWGRRLQYHPHVHVVVSLGGLTARGGWWRCGRSFFAPVRTMSKVFRVKLLEGGQEACAYARPGRAGLGPGRRRRSVGAGGRPLL